MLIFGYDSEVSGTGLGFRGFSQVEDVVHIYFHPVPGQVVLQHF